MRRLVGCLLLYACTVGVASIQAQEREVRSSPIRLSDHDLPGLDKTFTLRTYNEPMAVTDLIDILAKKGNLKNVVITPRVTGKTKLKLEDVTVGDALEIVLSVNNLAYEVKGGIVTIMTDEEYALRHGTSFYDFKKVKLIDLKYADPTRVATMLASVKSSIGTVVADPVTGGLILVDTPPKIKEMEAIIAKADIDTISRVIETETKTFKLQYATVEDIEGDVNELLSKEVGAVRSDSRTRTLIVTDLPHRMRKIESLVKTFDRRPKQVFIEAKIVETSLQDDFSMTSSRTLSKTF